MFISKDGKLIFQKSLETHQTKKSDLDEQFELKQTRAQFIQRKHASKTKKKTSQKMLLSFPT